MQARRLLWALITVAAAAMAACGSSPGDTNSPQEANTPANLLYDDPVARSGERPVDLVIDWLDLHLDLVQREAIGPPYATRMFAHAAVALQLADALADPDGEPADIEGLTVPTPPDGTVNRDVAGAVAVAEVTRQLMPSSAAQRSIAVLEAQQVAAVLGEGDHRQDPSVVLGLAVADAVMERAANDGFDAVDTQPHQPGTLPGSWKPTPPEFLFGLEPEWGQVAALMVDTSQCPVPEPVVFDDTPGSAFDDQAMVVADLRANLTDEQKATAAYWDDRPGFGATPTGHWLHILAAQLDADATGGEPPSRAEAARAYAAVAVASSDTFIATWLAKYDTDVLRPITYLRQTLDPQWRPYLTTPNHPSYPSGHSAGSQAAADALMGTIDDRPFTDTFHINDPDWPNRSYSGFGQAAAEASASRLYGGIHYPMDADAGEELGRCVAAGVLDRL
jgi:membrane-associated phospholipid phosphatase